MSGYRSGRGERTSSGAPSPWAVIPGAVAPFLALLGLVVVGSFSVSLLGGTLPALPGIGVPGGPIRTPTPSNVVVIDPRTNVPGTIVYVKAGNLWLQSGATAKQLTTGAVDAMPSWSRDGQWIYFVRIRPEAGRWPVTGVVKPYDLEIPSLMRIHADGTGLAALLEGRFVRGSNLWSYFIRQPVLAPDGASAAIITDGPDPTRSDLVLKLLDLATGTITNPRLPDVGGLGHQDPAWSPDGKTLLYVKDAREGAKGAATIVRYDLATKKTTSFTGPGYLFPAWSPDGRYVAATKTTPFGTDIVVLDARNGFELLRLTGDENSFAPVWSPAGDAIAFFRVDHGVIDLELIRLSGTAPAWTVGDTIPLTLSAGLDATSRASWFIPPDQLPKPTPAVVTSPRPS